MISNLSNVLQPLNIFSSLQSGELNAATMMLQVQMMVTKDFDEQMRSMGRQIKFLNGIKQAYRDRIQTVQGFLTQNPNTTRKDGKRYIEASAQQGQQVFGSLVEFKYDLSDFSVTEQPLKFSDSGADHSLDDDGYAGKGTGQINSGGLADFFSDCANAGDSKAACDAARKAGDDDTSLPFYYGHTNNTFEDGSPKFAILVESIEMMLEQIKGKLSDVEQEAEGIATSLNQISAQRKAALDGAYQLVRKAEEMKSNTINKIQ